MNFFAILNNRRGQRYLDDTDALDRAAAAFERAIHYTPDWSVPWYNLGLVYKRQRRWPESLYRNLRAAELDPTDEAAWQSRRP
jgi:tetratricopeptide (TPR) repeat protein